MGLELDLAQELVQAVVLVLQESSTLEFQPLAGREVLHHRSIQESQLSVHCLVYQPH